MIEETLKRIEDKIDKLGSLSPLPRLMDLKAAASYSGRSLNAIQHMVKRGLLPVTKIDSKVQIDRVALDKLINESSFWQKVG